MIDKVLDVSEIPLLQFTLHELLQRYLPIRYTPKAIVVTKQQHEKVLSGGNGVWSTWRGIPIRRVGDMEE